MGVAFPVIDGGFGAGDDEAEDEDEDEGVPNPDVLPELAPPELTPPLEGVEEAWLVAVDVVVEVAVAAEDACPLAAALVPAPNGFRDAPVRCECEGVVWTFRVGIEVPAGGGELGN